MFTKMLTKMFTTKKKTPAHARVIPLSDGNLKQVVGGIRGSLPQPPCPYDPTGSGCGGGNSG
jgi:hypothetical protein